MQLIDFSYRVWLAPELYARARDVTFQAIRQALSAVPGVEAVTTRQSTFDIRVQRPSAETGKAISDELSAAIAEIDGVQEVKEVRWARVPPAPEVDVSTVSPAFAARMAAADEREATGYRQLAEAAETRAAAWRAQAAGTAAAGIASPGDEGHVARVHRILSLTEPGERVLQADVGLAASASTRKVGEALREPGCPAPWRVVQPYNKHNKYRVSETWRDEHGHGARWAEQQLEAEGSVFEATRGTKPPHRVITGGGVTSLATLARRDGERHGSRT